MHSDDLSSSSSHSSLFASIVASSSSSSPSPARPSTPTSTPPTSSSNNNGSGGSGPRKRTVDDFAFGRELGIGSYSTVVLATERQTGREFAVKILDKKHIIKEKKIKYVNVEKNVLNKLAHPLVVRLYFTFQDAQSLYFVLDFAKNGELLDFIRKVGSFDEMATRFYAAELLLAIEYIHSQNIIHRDLKPENILLDDKMHIKLTDFGTAKMLDEPTQDGTPVRANSFVGTAEYVSPELLTDKNACKASDLWALGCIVYQLLAGRPPFKGANEYQTFQKIIKLEYTIPPGFPEKAKDLVTRLLILDPTQRIGSGEDGFVAIKRHPFFDGIDWDKLHTLEPPPLLPYLPATADGEALRSSEQPNRPSGSKEEAAYLEQFNRDVGRLDLNDPHRAAQIKQQKSNSRWAKFLLDNELILMSGSVNKRKGLFAKRRQLILTDLPRLIYIDEEKMVQKGEIPWSDGLKPEYKNRRTFFVHTAKRTYYLEDLNSDAQKWCDLIDKQLAATTSSSSGRPSQ